jgi:hypothetical protein
MPGDPFQSGSSADQERRILKARGHGVLAVQPARRCDGQGVRKPGYSHRGLLRLPRPSRGQVGEALASLRESGRLTRHGLITADNHVDIERIEFDAAADATLSASIDAMFAAACDDKGQRSRAGPFLRTFRDPA